MNISSLLPSSLTSSVASYKSSAQKVENAAQDSNFGSAFHIDLSPEAKAAMKNTGTKDTSANATSSVFSNVALTYSAGNTGALNTNHGFFEQLLNNTSPANSDGVKNASQAPDPAEHRPHRRGNGQDSLSQLLNGGNSGDDIFSPLA